MSSPVIKLKRGAFADLPTLAVGEPGFTTDRYQLFVGSSDGNKLIGGGEFWNLNSTTVGAGIKLYEATNNGSNFVELKSPNSLGSDQSFVLPGSDGAADTVLKTDGSGNLTFAAVNSLSNAGLDNVVEDTSPQLGGNLDLNSSDVTGTGNINISGNVTASGDLSVRGGNVIVNSTGVNVSGTLTAANLSGALNTSDLSGTITNAQLGGSISDDKLNQITTADKVAVSALDINGATDIGAAVVDADLFIVDDGAGGTNRKTTASRLKSYVLGGGGGGSSFDSIVVGSGVTIDVNGIDAPTGIVTASSFVGFDYLQAPFGSTVTFTVTVASKDSTHRYNGTGSGSAYIINGVQSPFLTLTPGRTYRFNLSSSDQSSHPFRFYLEADKTTQYSTNVTTASTYTEITITDETPVVLHYQCSAHGYMGNAVQVNSNVVNTNYAATIRDSLTVSGNINANGNIVGDNSTNISGINQATATTFVGDVTGNASGNAGSADQVKTVTSSTNATMYPTFVADNNGSATNESLFTDVGIGYNPSANTLIVANLNVSSTSGLTIDGVNVTSTGTELNVLDGIPATLTATELGYVDGVTSAIQTQLDAKGTLTNQNDLVTLSGVSAGSTTLGTFTGSTISDNKSVKSALQELETQVETISGGGVVAVTISVGATDTDASFFPTFVSDNNTNPSQESLKTDAGISYNPNSNLLTLDSVLVSGDITAQGNVSLGDQSSDTVSFTGRVNTDVVPSSDSARQLGSNSLRWSEVYSDNVTGTNFTAAGILTAADYRGGSLTLSGGGNFGGNVSVTGNLSVGGSITSVNIEDYKVLSPLVEVGLEDAGDGTFQPPSIQTQYNAGLAMFYNPVGVSSANAKAAAVFAAVKPGASFRIGFATDVSFSGAGTTDGVATVNAWADIEAKGLWINDCAGQSQVISCTGSERFLNNISVDGGSF